MNKLIKIIGIVFIIFMVLLTIPISSLDKKMGGTYGTVNQHDFIDNYFMEEIVKSGLVDYLIENLNPSCIILFGSIRKGDSVGESDIDIFVESFVKK